MKHLFQKWLLIFVSVAFLLTFGISWFVHSSIARKSALELLRTNLEAAVQQMQLSATKLQTITAMSNASALAKARALAHIIADKPGILQNDERMQEVRELLDVDELHISDEKGILIATIPRSYQGYDMASQKQSAEFLPALTNPDFALVQAPQPNGSKNIIFQYAGVARLDKPGIVQIGYHPARVEEESKLADPHTIISAISIGRHGKILLSPLKPGDGNLKELIFRDQIDNKECICVASHFGQYQLTACLPIDEMYLSRNSVIHILIIGNLFLFIVIFYLVSGLLQKVVIRGIYSVNDSLKEITKGNLEERVDVKTTEEFQALSQGINTTVDALKKAIENEARRLDAELETGRIIQASVLPTNFPCNDNCQLFAAMYAAKEVGGDFYDFFMIDASHLAMLVADVSGKGITGALYMMNSKALLRDLIQAGKSPAQAFDQANQELCQNNQAHMFVTAFLSVLDLRTGVLTCVNAGHNPPLLQRGTASWEYLRIRHSVALGGVRKAKYTEVPVALAPGDRLLFYTDGVTEAMNPAGELYGESRLQEALNTTAGTPEETIGAIREKLITHASGTPQSDDITLLMLDFLQKLPE